MTRLIALAVACVTLPSFSLGLQHAADASRPTLEALQQRIADQAAEIASLRAEARAHRLTADEKEILRHFSIVSLGDGQGNRLTTIQLSRANLQIVDGTGTTAGPPTGLGNLVIGYNESRYPAPDLRTGSHNLIVGRGQNYSSWGGSVAGLNNSISNTYAVVAGGWGNQANGVYSTVSGGNLNTANGPAASVSGGRNNTAGGPYSSICGGESNRTGARGASVSGGTGNRALGEHSSVSGGSANATLADEASISGGFSNLADGSGAWVGGGQDNRARALASSVSGGFENSTFGLWSSVSGGAYRSATGIDDWVAGSLFEDD